MYRIPVSVGTRLAGIIRVKEGNRSHFQVWIAVKNRADNPERWQGTYFQCNDDGSVVRVLDDGHTYDEFVMKEPD